MKQKDFTITVHFSNGISLEMNVPLKRAVALSSKENVIVPDEVDYVEIKTVSNSVKIPSEMIFVVPKSIVPRNTGAISRKGLFKRDNARCAYCGKELTMSTMTVDHVIPKAQGGKNIWENVVASCRPCNFKKGNKTPKQAHMTLNVKPYNPFSKKGE